jgi:hypothetical protein
VTHHQVTEKYKTFRLTWLFDECRDVIGGGGGGIRLASSSTFVLMRRFRSGDVRVTSDASQARSAANYTLTLTSKILDHIETLLSLASRKPFEVFSSGATARQFNYCY